MRSKLLLFSICLLSIGFSSNAQSFLFGSVTDNNKKALPFASVILLKDSIPIDGTTTGSDGRFTFRTKVMPQTNYKIKITLVGYTSLLEDFTYTDSLRPLTYILQSENITMSGVTVSARKPLVIRRADRFILDIENSSLANGNSAFEVLQQSPGVWVNSDGSIRIKNNQPVVVMINDVIQRMSTEELAEFLKSMKSEDISKIEVITNPPAEFEAAGAAGIVHIVLKRPRNNGLTGIVSLRYKQQDSTNLWSVGPSIDYKHNKFYFSGNYSFTSDDNASIGNTKVKYSDGSFFENDTRRINNNDRYQYRLALAYEISPYHMVGVQTINTKNILDQIFRSKINFEKPVGFTDGLSQAYWLRNTRLQNTTLNYNWKTDTLGSFLKIIADFTSNDKKEQNQLIAAYSDSSNNVFTRTNTPAATNMISVQGDYSKVLKGNTSFKGGLKSVAISRDNKIIGESYESQTWKLDSLGNDHFQYKEHLFMAYTSIEKVVQNTSVKLGLRAEQTKVNGNSLVYNRKFERDYFGLFPSVFVLQSFGKKNENSVFFNYSRRLQRPAFNDLNPYRLQVHNFTIMTGNPDLVPQYTHNFQMGTTLLRNYNAEIYYSTTKNLISLLASPIGDKIIEYKPYNFEKGREIGMSLNLPVQILKSWTSNNSFSFSKVTNTVNNKQITQSSFSAKTSQTISIKNIMEVNLISEYRSPYVSANSIFGEMFYFDFMLSRRILKEKVRIRLYVSDLFNTLQEIETTDLQNAHIDFFQKRQTRSASLTLTYNFKSGKKFTQKGIDQGNNDERSRM